MKNSTFILVINIQIIFIFCSLISCATNTKQSVKPIFPPPEEAGKCYAKCHIKDQYSIRIDSFPVYSNIDNVAFTTKVIKTAEGSLRWVKKKAERNCLSADPNDCAVWCYVEIPAQIRTIKVPIDPSTAGTVSYQEYEIRTLKSKGGFTEWREIVCNENITADLVKRVQKALIKNGYDVGKGGANNFLAEETKAALVKYQIDNGLPVGQLDFATLEALGVNLPQDR